ncbi:oligosaccharide flippase family protein [Lactiplantibacillus plantarum]|uniref:oligosaccharide flippase family protein n=1 Tax=Lactiplantibacillus plantarum TaxID=1590 RepID=UPI001897FF6F|nr:oligosaccharide flippase family protein [Lactiplantibacillus plantarum]
MKDNFFKSLTILVTGSVLAQLISIVISPISTRFFSPSDFGSYTLITTAVSMFGPILCLKYDMAIVSASNRKEQANLIAGSIIITLISSFLVSIFYGIFVVGKGFSIYLFVFLYILLVSYGINIILLSFNNAKSEYSLISKVTIVKSLVQAVFTIITGLLHLGSAGLLLTQTISQSAGSLRQSQSIRNDKGLIKLVSLNSLRQVLKKYIQQPIFNSPAALLTTVTYSSINILISRVYSNSMLGYYSLSYRMLGLPFMIISANIAKIFFKEAEEEYKLNKKFTNTLRKTLKILIVFIIPFMILLFIFAPLVFEIVFGEKWVISGKIVRILVPMFTARLIVDSLTSAYIIKSKQFIELIIQIGLLGFELTVYFIAITLKINIYDFLKIISIVYTAVYLLNFIIIVRLSKKGRLKND